jgi:small-conductance mechanosensitive channel
MTVRKALLWLMLVSLALSAAGGALAVLTAGSDTIWRVVGTGLAAAVAAGLLLANSMVLDKEKSRASGLLGMAAVVAAFLLTLALIWELVRGFTSGRREEESIALTLFAVLLAALPTMLFLRLSYVASARWAGQVGVTTCAVAFVMMLIGSWWDPIGSSTNDRAR